MQSLPYPTHSYLPSLFAIRSERPYLIATSLRLLGGRSASRVGNASIPIHPYPYSTPITPPPRSTRCVPTGQCCRYLPYRDVRFAIFPTTHSAFPGLFRMIRFRSEARSQPHRPDPIRYHMSLRLGLIPPCSSCSLYHRFLTIATPSLPMRSGPLCSLVSLVSVLSHSSAPVPPIPFPCICPYFSLFRPYCLFSARYPL
jgi:hypothetical protein